MISDKNRDDCRNADCSYGVHVLQPHTLIINAQFNVFLLPPDLFIPQRLQNSSNGKYESRLGNSRKIENGISERRRRNTLMQAKRTGPARQLMHLERAAKRYGREE
jgi:hypothetical protein